MPPAVLSVKIVKAFGKLWKTKGSSPLGDGNEIAEFVLTPSEPAKF